MSASNTQEDGHNVEEVEALTSNAAPLPGVNEINEDRASNDDTTGVVKSHWRVPAVMVLTLLSGVLLAIGHHLFYAQYHGKPVHGSIGQQWVTRIGTGFAFLVQMLLVIAAGSAYVQRQWLSLGSRTHRIDQVDSMFGVLEDVTLFFDKVWFTNLLLALLAGITWWIPLAAVVTPGSLVVEPRMKLHDTILRPAQLQYNASHFANLKIPGILEYYGPNYITGQIAVAAATSGQILQISSANQNETYSLNFFGPAIRCAPNEHVRTAVVKALKHLSATDFDLLAENIFYAAWVPSDAAHGAPTYNFSSTEAYVTLDASDDDRKRLMVASVDGLSRDGLEKGRNINLTVHECMLYNASYAADFEFQYPNQAVTIRSIEIKQPIECSWDASVITVANEYTWGGLGPGNHNVSYMSIMDAFGSVLVGYAVYTYNDYCSTHNGTTYCQHTISTQGGTRFDQTQIDWTSSITTSHSLETLFQNITLSMLSSSQMTYNYTSTPVVPAQLTSYPNTYVYSTLSLWLSYGIAIAATLFCVCIGFHAIHANRATYSNRFSTILRTTRDAQFDRLVECDDDGSDPLPEAIARAELCHEGHRRASVEKGRRRRRIWKQRRGGSGSSAAVQRCGEGGLVADN